MNTLLLIMLLIVEVGLAVLTFSEDKTQKSWLKNRAIAGAIEVAVFLIFSFFPGIDFGIRFKALLFILIIKACIFCISMLIGRKATGEVKAGKIVVSTLLSIVFILMGIVPSYIFCDYAGPTPTGEYAVKTASAILVDNSRIEEFEEDGSYREVPIDFYYPDVQDDAVYPLVVFSHGAFGYSRSNFSMYQELASHGYVVASLSHPYHSFFCKDTAGKIVTVNPQFMHDALYINDDNTKESEIFELSKQWINLRTLDMTFAIDTLEKWNDTKRLDDTWYVDENFDNNLLTHIDFDKIGIIGHSLGGATAVNVGRICSDVDAVVDIDGTMLGEQVDLIEAEPIEFEGIVYDVRYTMNEEPYPTALLNIDNEEHHNSRLEAKKVGMPYANNEVMEHAICGYDTYFANAGHMNLTDLPLVSPFLAKMLGTGSIDSKECVDTLNQVVLSFYNDVLKDEGEFVVEEVYGN